MRGPGYCEKSEQPVVGIRRDGPRPARPDGREYQLQQRPELFPDGMRLTTAFQPQRSQRATEARTRYDIRPVKPRNTRTMRNGQESIHRLHRNVIARSAAKPVPAEAGAAISICVNLRNLRTSFFSLPFSFSSAIIVDRETPLLKLRRSGWRFLHTSRAW